MSQQEALAQHSKAIYSESAQTYGDDGARHDSDDEPMVYRIPKDYATIARQERDSLLAECADPDSVILQSELHNYVPRRENDSADEYTKRYADTMMDMVCRGVRILNDMLTGDAMPDTFGTASGKVFDLGPESGSTKGEYREFKRWLWGVQGAEQIEVPEKWLKFEKPAEGKKINSNSILKLERRARNRSLVNLLPSFLRLELPHPN
ncbi:uncharacterized protein N7498_009697 [Penicillium cinerascens]|uniref:Uncharacterized protein n=1 Tax=Penicillium cinerascens TaxID=70096 RepID=A0A9W9J6E2_9EURO|nr:uncharacterized protein N7498_009697 [Penicillium cinerascens]KAJ5190712.1 hypothetical protein N7498_009697 [Penicillium cinerascens]